MSNCRAITVNFAVKENNPQMKAVEDDIRANLEEIGISVDVTYLDDEAYTVAERSGEYHLFFSGTWGAPYDPHSYLSSWAVVGHVENSAIGELKPPLTKADLTAKVENVQTQTDLSTIQSSWHDIMDDIHSNALFMPLWGTVIPYVLNRRLTGFSPPSQAFSIPVNTIQVVDGSEDVTICPGTGSLFKSAGPLNPHQYSPNQLWAQDWVYEGLVSYGQDGAILPALATGWTNERAGEGEKYTFQLRRGVTFHDGFPWNCAAAKLNLDHVLHDVVRQRHLWYGIPKYLKSWTCSGEHELVLETSRPFYPFLQELTYIRPLRFASPAAFAEGLDSSGDLHNSCEPGLFGSRYDFLEDSVTCLGLKSPVGTGPLQYVSREKAEDGTDSKVVFSRFDDYWGTKPGLRNLTVVQYKNTDEVYKALMSGELDMAMGNGPLTPAQVQDLKFYHTADFQVRHSDVLQHSLLVFNSTVPPTDDIAVRQAIIHAIDKGAIIEKEFSNLEKPADQLLPRTAPFCNVDLTPKWGYDIVKAKLLNCPPDSEISGGIIAGISVAALAAVLMLGFIVRLIQKERQGQPVFKAAKSTLS